MLQSPVYLSEMAAGVRLSYLTYEPAQPIFTRGDTSISCWPVSFFSQTTLFLLHFLTSISYLLHFLTSIGSLFSRLPPPPPQSDLLSQNLFFSHYGQAHVSVTQSGRVERRELDCPQTGGSLCSPLTKRTALGRGHLRAVKTIDVESETFHPESLKETHAAAMSLALSCLPSAHRAVSPLLNQQQG